MDDETNKEAGEEWMNTFLTPRSPEGAIVRFSRLLTFDDPRKEKRKKGNESLHHSNLNHLCIMFLLF